MKILSHSAIEMYENCPKNYNHSYNLRDIPKVELESSKWGKRVHDQIMGVVKRSAKFGFRPEFINGDLEQYRQWIEIVCRLPGKIFVEEQFGIDAECEPSPFFDLKTVFRMVADVVVVDHLNKFVCVIDWKTGKRRETFSQLDRYAMVLSRYYPGYQVAGIFIWLKDGSKTSKIYNGDEILAILQEEAALRERVVHATQFPPKPSPLCGWCSVNYAGKCEFAERKWSGGAVTVRG